MKGERGGIFPECFHGRKGREESTGSIPAGWKGEKKGNMCGPRSRGKKKKISPLESSNNKMLDRGKKGKIRERPLYLPQKGEREKEKNEEGKGGTILSKLGGGNKARGL